MYAEFIHANALGQTLMNGPEMWVHRKAEWVSNVVEGTWESRTIDELAPREGDVVIRKSRGSAAYNTYLIDHLKERGVTSVLLTGIASSGCVLRTAVGSHAPRLLSSDRERLCRLQGLGTRLPRAEFPNLSVR